MAKHFFYVCAGLFLLAGAFALGARSVGAQDPEGQLYAADFGDQVYAVDFDYRFRAMDANGGSVQVWAHPIPSPHQPKAAHVLDGMAYVVVANGDVFRAGASEPWLLTGNLFAGATPVSRHTLGQIKQRFDNGGGR